MHLQRNLHEIIMFFSSVIKFMLKYLGLPVKATENKIRSLQKNTRLFRFSWILWKDITFKIAALLPHLSG